MVLAQEETDLKTTALVPADVSLSLSSPIEPSTAFIIAIQPGKFSVEVDAKGDGLLVLSNIDYPGWIASIINSM